ncbi:MAG: radical SAM protein [Pseudomonadota bacterium]|nr:radical SAM protein [Pseudomonadota bacterium]
MSAVGDFGGYLSGAFPSQLNVDVTEFCNLACVHCPYVSVTKPKGRERKNLSAVLHAKLVHEVATEGKEICRFVRYTGEGEPLLHPHIMTFLAEMRRTGVTTALTTNGLLLTEGRCHDLLETGVNVVDISLDAFKPETYAKIRVGGELEIAREGILRLFHMGRDRGSEIKIMVSFIRQAMNEGEADDFMAFWKGQGLHNVFVRNLHSCAGLMTDVSALLWKAAPTPRKPCLYPWERLLLKPDGMIAFCPADWEHGTAIDSFAEKTIKELWQGDFMRSVREAHTTNDYSAHPFCGKCPDWSLTLWPTEGRTYATAMHEVEKSQVATGQALSE